MLGATGCAAEVSRPAVVFTPHAVRFPQAVEARIQRIEARLNLPGRMASYQVPGVSIAVVNNGVVEWARGYGSLQAGGHGGHVTQDTLFQAASVSKAVTAMAALRLVQDGRLALDEDVNVRLRSWKLPTHRNSNGRPVTLRHLLSHTGGISVHGFRGYAQSEGMPGLDDVLQGRGNSQAIRQEAPTGSGYKYSGGGYIVVQKLMTDVSGERFEQLMQDMVLGPLQMTHSTFEQPLPESFWRYAAHAHYADGRPVPGRWHNYPELAAAGLWTTPTDLARYIIEVENAASGRPSRVLAQQVAQQMITPHGPMGLGLKITGQGYGTRFSHGGSNSGFRSYIVGSLYTGQGVVVMSNSDNGGKLNGEIASAIEAEYGWGGAEAGGPAPAPMPGAPGAPQPQRHYGNPEDELSFLDAEDTGGAFADAVADEDVGDPLPIALATLSGTMAH